MIPGRIEADRVDPLKCRECRPGETEGVIPAHLLLWRGFNQLVCALAHLGGALDLVPVEGLAVDGALERLEEHDGEDLAVGEALQPDVEEQPAVAFVGGMAALQAEGDRRGDEVDEQEAEEVGQQLFKAGRGGGFGVVVAVDEVVDDAGQRT